MFEDASTDTAAAEDRSRAGFLNTAFWFVGWAVSGLFVTLGAYVIGVVAALAAPVVLLGSAIFGDGAELLWRKASVRASRRGEYVAAVSFVVAVAAAVPLAIIFHPLIGIGVGATGLWATAMVYGLERTFATPAEPFPQMPSEDAFDLDTAAPIAAFRHVDIFQHMNDEELATIVSLGRTRSVPQGTLLASRGDYGEAIFVVLAGRAELTAASGVGTITVRVAGPGESFPLAALVGDTRLITTVHAMTDMKIWQVDLPGLNAFFMENPAASAGVYRTAAGVLAGRYRNTLSRLTVTAERALRDADFWVNI